MGIDYYPGGGWYDFIGWFPAVDAAMQGLSKQEGDWAQLIDVKLGTVIFTAREEGVYEEVKWEYDLEPEKE